MSITATAKRHVSDILDCLAQLSNDQVPTRRAWPERCWTSCRTRCGPNPTASGSIPERSQACSSVNQHLLHRRLPLARLSRPHLRPRLVRPFSRPARRSLLPRVEYRSTVRQGRGVDLRSSEGT